MNDIENGWMNTNHVRGEHLGETHFLAKNFILLEFDKKSIKQVYRFYTRHLCSARSE